MNECDLLLVLGASFSKRTGVTPKKPTIQVDFDPLALSKFHAVDCAFWGEISAAVGLLKDALTDEIQTVDQRPELTERWRIWREEKQRGLQDNHGNGLTLIAVFDGLNRFALSNAVMCVAIGLI